MRAVFESGYTALCSGIDLPELTSIQLGSDAFIFQEDDSTELVLRSVWISQPSSLDLPRLTSLWNEGDNSCTFRLPHHIILEGVPSPSPSFLELPALAEVKLPNAFLEYHSLSRKSHTLLTK